MPKKSKDKTEKKNKKESSKKISLKEFEKKVAAFADEGLTSEKIGERLKKEGIHPKEHGKKISKILKEKENYVNPDLKNLEEKLKRIKEHFEKNKQDKEAMRDRDKTFSKLRKLKRYHNVS